jgi:hypothetical protein
MPWPVEGLPSKASSIIVSGNVKSVRPKELKSCGALERLWICACTSLEDGLKGSRLDGGVGLGIRVPLDLRSSSEAADLAMGLGSKGIRVRSLLACAHATTNPAWLIGLVLHCGFQGQGVGNKPHNCALLPCPKVGRNLPRPEKHDARMENVYYLDVNKHQKMACTCKAYGDEMPEHT